MSGSALRSVTPIIVKQIDIDVAETGTQLSMSKIRLSKPVAL